MFGGWRVVVVEEADYLASCPKASHLWLSILDAIPARTTIVFTTNHPEKFAARFLDRVERIDFDSDPVALAGDARRLVSRIWREKTGRDDAPALGALCDPAAPLSFRRIVGALEPAIRAAGSRRRNGNSDVPTRPRVVAAKAPESKPVPEPAPEPESDGRGIPGPAFPGRPAGRKPRSARPDMRSTTFPEPPAVPTVGEPDPTLLSMIGPDQLRRIGELLDARYIDLGRECARVEAWQRAVRAERRRRASR